MFNSIALFNVKRDVNLMIKNTFIPLIVLFTSCNTIAVSPEIKDAFKCSSKMGQGGNYYSKEVGKLAGKCEGQALPPILVNDTIVFSVPKKTDYSKLYIKSNDRTELAFTGERIKYNQDYLIDFKVQVDPNSDITNEFFYVMQIWQSPEYSPIFGLRVDRGTKSRGAFVIRNEEDSLAGKRLVRVNLESQLQHYQIYMNIGKDMRSKIRVYENLRLISKYDGLVGYPVDNSQNQNGLLIMKFGLYKGPEPSKSFKVTFKDVSLKLLD